MSERSYAVVKYKEKIIAATTYITRFFIERINYILYMIVTKRSSIIRIIDIVKVTGNS